MIAHDVKIRFHAGDHADERMVGRQCAARERCYFAQQLRLLRIDVRLTNSLEPVFALDDVERAVIGERRHGEAHQSSESGLVIERCTEHATRLSKQRRALL